MPSERELTPYSMERHVPSPYVRQGGADAIPPGVNLRRTWLVLYKRRYLIVGTVVLVCLLAVLSEQNSPRTYLATTQIRIDPVNPATAHLGDLASILVDNSYYKTEYVLLKSPTLAKRVIETLKLYDDPRFTRPAVRKGIVADIRALAIGAWNGASNALRALFARRSSEQPEEATASGSESNVESRVEPLVDAYLAHLTVSPIETSRLVRITYSAPDPELAASIANTHAGEFSKMTVEARLDVNDEAQKILEQRLTDLKKRTEESEADLNNFRRQHRVLAVGGNEKENVALERLATLNVDYAKAQSERIAAEAEYDLVKRRHYDQLASVQRDSTYNALKEQLEQLRSEYGRLAQVYMPSYPKMVALSGQIGSLEGRIAEQVHKGVAGVESQYLGAKGKEDALAAEIEKARQDVLDLNDLSVEYQVLARAAEADRQLYTTLITKTKTASLVGTMQASNVQVVDPATAPAGPSLLEFRQSLTRAIILGLVLGFGLAFLLEYLDSTVKTPEDAEEFLQIPSLAVVPSFSYTGPNHGLRFAVRRWGKTLRFGTKAERKNRPILLTAAEDARVSEAPPIPSVASPPSRRHRKGRPSELLVIERPSSAIAEAYRTLRTAMMLSSADKPPKIIQLTSTASREGKTVTSVNVALTLAQSGARVLLLDADLRRPRCHTIFGVNRVPGLVDYLVGHSSLDQCVHPLVLGEVVSAMHGVPGARAGNGNGDGAGNGTQLLTGTVHLLPVGTKAPNPAELLGSMRMRETLGMLQDQYDYVIIDSPPVLPVADSVVLCTLADAVVLVIKGQSTPKDLIRQALARLDRVNAKVIGSVINDVDVTSGDYYYYKGYYASYGYLDSSGRA